MSVVLTLRIHENHTVETFSNKKIRYYAHYQRRMVNTNPATNPSADNGDLPVRYSGTIVAQACGSNQLSDRI